jgi:hypothetical protein
MLHRESKKERICHTTKLEHTTSCSNYIRIKNLAMYKKERK